jgi:hypothetical protein
MNEYIYIYIYIASLKKPTTFVLLSEESRFRVAISMPYHVLCVFKSHAIKVHTDSRVKACTFCDLPHSPLGLLLGGVSWRLKRSGEDWEPAAAGNPHLLGRPVPNHFTLRIISARPNTQIQHKK